MTISTCARWTDHCAGMASLAWPDRRPSAVESSFKLGRIAGMEIGMHYTWALAFGLVAWSLAQHSWPPGYSDWDATTCGLLSVGTALAHNACQQAEAPGRRRNQSADFGA
jgi:hypothetical protein